ncbi:MAG: carboxymuconolactone decarboxylase family protein [Nannocystaceae bacterium]|nr:peroxidase-related enzyme [bacterium]
MPAIPPLDPADAPEETNAVYADFQRRMGFPAPPNFITTQGHSSSVTKGTWGVVKEVLLQGSIPRSVKELMFTAISQERGCHYCDAAHLACCRMLGVDPETLEQLAADVDSIRPQRVRDIVSFGVKCARAPRSLEAADFDSLRQHGLTDGEILEVISMAGLALYANTIADATGMEADRMFSEL